ncbi:hypothetical protein Cgig2_019288 [Carnegiea gigantea]|uniref:aspartate kinase n=1 Tax=Carnegiea gigantea TaxID=171969 RepID=A0A9Q1KNW8_9CARY|nr:hypothetical protein Cgig2_019288 [Carnegiea gigantea]
MMRGFWRKKIVKRPLSVMRDGTPPRCRLISCHYTNYSIFATLGQKMASTPGVSATLFDALAKANVNIRGIAQGCSGYNITAVIKRDDCIKALRAVHSRFYLSRTIIAMGIIGPWLIGGTLLDQLSDQAPDWLSIWLKILLQAAALKEKFNIDLRVMGITSSKKMLLAEL